MSELETTAAPTPAPAAESRALAEIASLEEARTDRAELAELGRVFDEDLAADLQDHPALVLVPNMLARNAMARMVRVTLRVARRYGARGVPVALLKQVFQALEVPPGLAEAIERKLTVDGVGGVSCGRLYFTGTRESWARLAATRAE
jgi:hypothetical protein